ncbi:MAG TPA: iron ABC transporter permease [Cyclobacteriaceae bacterium]|jgi:iron complex transport system permease protein
MPRLILAFSLLALTVIDLSYGSVSIPPGEVLRALFGGSTTDPVWKDIVMDFRLAKSLTCILAGAALGVAGLQMQTLFRNPLAGPDVLGLTSGASLAVSLLILRGSSLADLPGPWSVAVVASIGCTAVFLVVLLFARRLRDPASLLIVGLMIGALASSIVSVLQFRSRSDDLQIYFIWTFGNVSSLNWPEIGVLAWILVAGLVLALTLSKPLNAWMLGDNYAQSLGIRLQRSRVLIILSASLLTGGVTAFCGPIAFVGLAVPHLARLLTPTSDHRVMLPNVALGGGILLLLCDILSQLPPGPEILPVNAITALFGAPVVIWVVIRSKMIRL